MIKLPPSVFSFSHDSWQKLVKFYESAIAAGVVVDAPEPEPTPVFEEEDVSSVYPSEL